MQQLALTLITLITFSANSGYGQTPNRLAVELETRKNQRSYKPAQTHLIFQKISAADQSARTKGKISSYTLAEFLPVVSTQLRRSADDVISLEIPFQTQVLTLELFRIVDDPIVVRTSDGGIFQDNGLHYRGILKGDVQSTAAISIYGDELVGVISSDTYGNIVLGKWPEKDAHVIYSDRDLTEKQDFNCEALDRPDVMNDMQDNINRNGRSVAGKCTRIYFEVSYDLYVASARDRSRVQNYISGIFNQVATLYANEGISIQISEMYIWTSPDPYKGNASDHLENFLSRRTSHNGDLAHLLTVGTGNGGIAYVDVLCSSNYGYGYSDIGKDYAVFPSYSWTVNVIAHELGHNLGSPHTHACKWGPLKDKALDNCFPTEGSCKAGPQPSNGGTLMSYCHIRANGINFNHGLGQEPGDRIRNRIAGASCLSDCGRVDAPASCRLEITNVEVTASKCGEDTGEIVVATNGSNRSTRYTVGSTSQSSNKFIGLAAGSYTVTASNGSTCTVEKTIEIASEGSNIKITHTSVDSDCNAENGEVMLTADGGKGPYQYTLGRTTQSSPDFVALAPGSYEIEVVDADGCKSSGDAVVSVTSGPELASTVDQTSCGQSNGRIVLVASGGKAPYSYTLGDQENDSGTFQNLTAGSYQAAVVDAAGCSVSTASLEVDESIEIEATIDVKHTSCGESNGQLAIDVNGGVGDLIFELNGSQRSKKDLDNLASGNYLVRISDVVGCVVEMEENIEASDAMTMSLDVIQPTCGKSNGEIEVAASGGTGSFEFGLNDVFGTNQLYSALDAGRHEVQVIDASGCRKRAQVHLEASTAPEIAAAVANTNCGRDDGRLELSIEQGQGPYITMLNEVPIANLRIDSLQGGNYMVEVEDFMGCVVQAQYSIESSTGPVIKSEMTSADCGLQNGSIEIQATQGLTPYQYSIGGAFQDGASFTELDTGTYQISLRDAAGCLAATSVPVTYDDRYRAPDLETAVAACQGATVQLNTGLDAEVELNWYRDEVQVVDLNASSVEVREAGTYRAEVIYNESCVLEATAKVTLHAIPEQVLPTRIDICEGEQFEVETVLAQHSYDWSNGQQGSDVLFEYSAEYALQITSPHGCTAEREMAVNIVPKEIFLDEDLRSHQVCEGNSIVLSEPGADLYQWYDGEFALIGDESSIEVWQNDRATYSVIGSNVCFSDTVHHTVEIFTDQAIVTSDTSVVEGSAIALRISGAIEQTWSTVFTQSCTDCAENIIAPDVTGSVFVDYIDINGCAGERVIYIEVIPIKDVIPQLVNVITPNQDGENDHLIFDGIENFHSTGLRVFDQNGNTVYHDENYENNWAGFLDDQVVSQGVYFYIVSFRLDDRVFEYDSSLTVLRD